MGETRGAMTLMPKPKDRHQPTCRLLPGGSFDWRRGVRLPRRKPIDLRPIVAECNARLLMTHLGQWLEAQWPWLFEEVRDGDDVPHRHYREEIE